MLTTTQKYNAILLASFRAWREAGMSATETARHIGKHIGNPSCEPSPQEARWLKVLSAYIDAELSEADDEDRAEEGDGDFVAVTPIEVPIPIPVPVPSPRKEATPRNSRAPTEGG